MTKAYTLVQTDEILSHLLSNIPQIIRDGISLKNPRLDAEARSGDYFTTVATRLEVLSQDIASKFPAAAQILDIIVSDLEYMQGHYTIASKLQAQQRKDG
jgi:uncharacterized membrane-anchored protein YhcB (DUF1043 family)